MKTSQFDFVRCREWRDACEQRVRPFFDGAPGANFLLEEHVRSNYVTCRTPRESLEVQLDGIARQMELDGGWFPYLEPWFGVGVYANAFGAEYMWWEGESPQTKPIVFDEHQAAKLEARLWQDVPAMRLVMEAIDYFLEQTRGEIPIACTDTQSPFDTATLLWDTSSFLVSSYTAPAAVDNFLKKITDLIISFSRDQLRRIGAARIQPGHTMFSLPGMNGLALSDDNLVMVGPEQYEIVSVKYNNIISAAFGGVAIHTCGNLQRQLPALLKTEGLSAIDCALSPQGDPDPNTDYEYLRDTLKGTGVILHARAGSDWPEILPRLYDPELRLILSVPAPREEEEREKTRKRLEQVLGACA